MNLSARNVMQGKVTSIEVGAVNVEVEIEIEIAPGVLLTSIITRKSCESLELEVGKDAYAVVKASSVMVAID